MEFWKLSKFGKRDIPLKYQKMFFHERYGVLGLQAKDSTSIGNILSKLGFPSTSWFLGNSKVFLKDYVMQSMELSRVTKMSNSVIIVQSYVRRFFAQQFLQNNVSRKKAVIVIQSLIRRYYARDALRLRILEKKKSIQSVVKIQSYVRRFNAQIKYLLILRAKIRKDIEDDNLRKKRPKKNLRKKVPMIGKLFYVRVICEDLMLKLPSCA